jgi:hypothetical protein
MDFDSDNNCWLAETCEGHDDPAQLTADDSDNSGIMQVGIGSV